MVRSLVCLALLAALRGCQRPWYRRDYQQALETLYTTALALTLDRWAFALHWFGTNVTTFSQFGSSETEVNTLTSTSHLGFTRNLAAGGQLLADFANSFVYTASG